MGKTYKDKANYYKHHLEQDVNMMQKSKYKISKEDIPEDIKYLVNKIQYNYDSSLRHGNNRKHYAKMKVSDRREDRNKDKVQVRQEVAMIF